MRVLILVHGYPPSRNGGTERRAARTAAGLAGQGIDITVMCVEELTETPEEINWTETREDGVLVRWLRVGPPAGLDPFVAGYDNPSVARAVEALIRERRPDVIHLFSGYVVSSSVIALAKSLDIPVVVSLTDYWWLCHRINLIQTGGARCDGPKPTGCARCQAEASRRYRKPAQAWPSLGRRFWRSVEAWPWLGSQVGVGDQRQRATMLRERLNAADALVAPSRFLAEVYINHGVDPKRVRVWRQGVAIEHCRLRSPSPSLRAGYLGQVKPHKGVHLLVEAWGRLSGPRRRSLVVAGSSHGEPDYGAYVRAMIDQLPDAAWPGQLHGPALWAVLTDIDVLVVPSRWLENSPNSIIEAQAVGVPVIGSNLGGIAELIQHEVNGLLFEPDDVDDLARQLQRLLDEPELLEQLRRVQIPFKTLDDEVCQLIGLYDEVGARVVVG
jgi:glycosyltransferase involved in cell wall biosynthesis